MQRGKEPNLRNLKEAKEMLGLKTSFLQPKPKKPLRPPNIPYSGIVFTLQTKPRSIWRHTLKKSQQNFLSVRVILTLQKFEISNFACCQIVPICSLISEQNNKFKKKNYAPSICISCKCQRINGCTKYLLANCNA